MAVAYSAYISNQLGLSSKSVENTLLLIEEGATIPFIARYRKEKTGNLDETQVELILKFRTKLKELDERRAFILQSVEEQGKLSDELKKKINSVMDITELEDLYLPFKRKRKTRAEAARSAGLEPLAKLIMGQRQSDIELIAIKYLNETVQNIEFAIQGAQDIIAEWISEDVATRDRLRHECRKFGFLCSSVIQKKKEEASHYRDYFNFREQLYKCPSHRFLAIMRGAEEGFLKTEVEIDVQRMFDWMERRFVKSDNTSGALVSQAIQDAYKRLLFPSVETQILNEYKDKADENAIKVFSTNLEQLLLAPPLGEKVVLGVDPGFRTGAKIVVLDSTSQLLEHHTIFPIGSAMQVKEATGLIKNLCYKYNVDAIAVGNGTASRETKDFLENIHFDRRPEIYIVSESGASIYSASEVAREEFPDLDLTYRGAVSIGRRLMDPLAELVKIDPKSIGVGQYQHDVNQSMLKDALHRMVESCVNRVGVNLNTASKHLLAYVSGLGNVMAEAIVRYRNTKGHFKSREELLQVPRLGNKTFEQCAGFLRIRDGENILDNTGVHPESYSVVGKMAQLSGMKTEDFVRSENATKQIVPQNFVTDKVGIPTILDILKELEKPGLDPRGQAKNVEFDRNVRSMEDLREGMVLSGVITNLTNFGAFVDIGVKQDGLIHISQITDKFIKTPAEVLKLGQEVRVMVINSEPERKRINLTMKGV